MFCDVLYVFIIVLECEEGVGITEGAAVAVKSHLRRLGG